ncbi:N-glycosyltransferase [Thermoplasmatales archaeon]|nr:N-glycosyltransferase [Thermoplasmatales archaeon]
MLDLLTRIVLYFFIAILVLIWVGLTYIAIGSRHGTSYKAGDFSPRTLVIVPCRGADFSLRENILSLMKQEYGNYETVAVVDSMDDPSVPVLNEVGIRIIPSNFACTGCSGKVRAIASALSKYDEFQAYVIADSDIIAEKNWLGDLVSPLKDEKYGIVTTFPYFRPVGGFWSRVKLVWGFVGLGMMESDITRFGWGGSLAFRRELISTDERMRLFSSSVSDDIALTKLTKSEGKKIFYARSAQPVINSPDNFSTFIEWANRQTALSESSSPSVFRYGILFFGASDLLFVSAIVLSIFVSPVFLLFFIPSILTGLKNTARSREIKAFVFLLSFLIPFIYTYNLIAGRRMKKISWRGREYDLQ